MATATLSLTTGVGQASGVAGISGVFSRLEITCDFVSSFEKTLKQKLSQKSTGVQSEEAVLLKAFKYFDLNNNGTVEPDEFAKAVEKIGIMIPTKQVSKHSLAVKIGR